MSEATKAAKKAAEKAKLAKFLAEKYGASGSKAAAAAAAAASSSAAADDEVEVMGERTRVERDAMLREKAVAVDSHPD